ncbi:MAG: DUF1538 domain-containing protein [Treponema sp.]|jgi:hypothetical protein|nr:DUF1538 domain-containing protein [Treponema sp.]
MTKRNNVGFFAKLKDRLFPRRQGMITLSFRESFSLINTYASDKIRPQFKAVLMVSVFLAATQLVLGAPLHNALSVVVCVGAAILGLSFFLEGLFLGIMPLGEQCGMRLPAKIGVVGVTVFSVIVGITATLAEPAVAVLQQQGSVIPAWNAPLLYLLLNRGNSWLVAAIAIGVGLSVVLGVYRFMFGWPFKPPVFIIIPIILAVSCIFDENPILRPLVNLAWDAGGAATGAVTVPIILALGLGAAQTGGTNSNNTGLGVVTLASALPVASVLFLAALIGPKVPLPSDTVSFFSAEPQQRAKAVYVAGSSGDLVKMAERAVYSGNLSVEEFTLCFPEQTIGGPQAHDKTSVFAPHSLLYYLKAALFAVLPLALVLIAAIGLVARDRVHNSDIVVLGVLFATIGMFALNLGMTGGITVLSSQAGSSLRYAYTETLHEKKAVTISGVDSHSLITVPGENGPEVYIWVNGLKGPILEKFIPQRLSGNRYTHIPIRDAMSSHFGTIGAYLIILVIVFFLGFLAIFAEPALAVIAVTVEEMTTGIFKRSKLIMIAAAGVGGGMAIGFARVLFSNLLPSGGIHLSWILAPCYGLALLLTIFAPEDFSSIAWDVAGIATGPIAVPIIITTGLGLGHDSLRADGAFGIVATASVVPIIVILVSGIIEKVKSKQALKSL